MGKPPAFQFYANDFMDATRMWDAFACGLYIRLLCIQWTHGSLPDDQRRLAMGAGCELGELQRHWHLIEPKIPLCKDGTRKNARLEAVRSRQLEVSAKRSGAADARWEAHANAYANAHAKTMQRKVKEKEKVEVEEEGGKDHKAEFIAACKAAIDANPSRLLIAERKAFLDYWTEPNKKGKMRFEGQDFFDHGRRMDTWMANYRKRNGNVEVDNEGNAVWNARA